MAEAYCLEQAAQKARKTAKAKVQEEIERRQHVEKEKKKKKFKYLKKLYNEVLTEEAVFKESAEIHQIIGTKYKKIIDISSEDKTG